MLPPHPNSTLFPYTTLFRSDGIQNLPYLDQLLPAAHAAGLKVYGWDFPKLASINDDVFRARVAVAHITPSGDHLRSEEHTSELQSRQYLVCRLLLEKKNKNP